MVSARRRGRGVEIAGFGRMPTPRAASKTASWSTPPSLGRRWRALRGKTGCAGSGCALPWSAGDLLPRAGGARRQAAGPEPDPGGERRRTCPPPSRRARWITSCSARPSGRASSFSGRGARSEPCARSLDGYRDAVRKAGFGPEAFDVACNAAFKACRLEPGPPAKAETVIYAGVREDELCLSLFGGGGTRLYREAQVAAPKSPVENGYSLSALVPETAGHRPESPRQGAAAPARRRPRLPPPPSSSS